MCGIIGIVSNKPVSINIINSLKKLEYRGYELCRDSDYKK